MDAEKFFNQLIGLQVLALGVDKDGVFEKMKELIPAYNQTPLDANQNGGYPEIIKSMGRDGLSDFSATFCDYYSVLLKEFSRNLHGQLSPQTPERAVKGQ